MPTRLENTSPSVQVYFRTKLGNTSLSTQCREIISVDSVQVYGETAIVQLPVTAWTTITGKLKKDASIQLPVSAYRNIRDRMFRSLFSGKKELLSLYNAVSDRDYTNPDDLEIVTLEGAIYMGMKNDISFIISNGHQGNTMPTRLENTLPSVQVYFRTKLGNTSLSTQCNEKTPP